MSTAQGIENPDQEPAVDIELLDCMRRVGRGLIAAGTSVGLVENTLTRIAMVYQVKCEIVALPNVLMIKIGKATQKLTDFTVQRPTSLPLNQISALTELIDRVLNKKTSPAEASKEVENILTMPPRFNALIMTIGYTISVIGLTLLFRPDLRAVLVTGAAGLMVGVLLILFKKWPRFNLLLPIIAAILVSWFIFDLTQEGLIFGPANLIISPLIIFLPGAILTTGMIELASGHLISGSARLMYGAASLLLLFIGIGVGLNISDLPSILVSTYEATEFPWWAPLLGTLFFGVGTFLRLSGANRDLFWMLVVLYIAMLGQTLGEAYFNSFAGAFLGAMLMALSSELIGRSPRRTPALVSQSLAFWFLVPGARGLLSVTNFLTDDLQSAVIGLGEMLTLITVITLGVFLGTLIVSANKFVPVSFVEDDSKQA